MSVKTKIVANLIFILFVSLSLTGCGNTNGDVERLSKSYQENGDYESLVALLPYLNYTMTRADVENLLGESVLCPVAASCTYLSNKKVIVSCPTTTPVSAETCQSFSLALVVRYDLVVNDHTMSPQDRLENFFLAPIGE